jgi:hypothetical protein
VVEGVGGEQVGASERAEALRSQAAGQAAEQRPGVGGGDLAPLAGGRAVLVVWVRVAGVGEPVGAGRPKGVLVAPGEAQREPGKGRVRVVDDAVDLDGALG